VLYRKCDISNDLDGPLTRFKVTTFLKPNIFKKTVRFRDKVTKEH